MKDLADTLTLRWIARSLGIGEDEALGAVMLAAAGIECGPELAEALGMVGILPLDRIPNNARLSRNANDPTTRENV